MIFKKIYKNSVLILLILCLYSYSAIPDSLKTIKKDNSVLFDNILPLSLIIIGSSLSGNGIENDIQKDIRNSVGNDFEFVIDDYIQYVPCAEIYLAKMIGVKSENNLFEMTKNLGIVNLTSAGIVWALKGLTDKTRPNGAKYSFPSGHTNFVFTNATVLYHEYKNSNKFVAYSGFVFAATTGMFRIFNNKHWTSDVLTGAGLGILVGNLVYKYKPLNSWHPFGLGANKNIAVFPQIGTDSYGLSIYMDLRR